MALGTLFAGGSVGKPHFGRNISAIFYARISRLPNGIHSGVREGESRAEVRNIVTQNQRLLWIFNYKVTMNNMNMEIIVSK